MGIQDEGGPRAEWGKGHRTDQGAEARRSLAGGGSGQGDCPEKGTQVAKRFSGKVVPPISRRGNTGGESWVWGKVKVPGHAQAGLR